MSKLPFQRSLSVTSATSGMTASTTGTAGAMTRRENLLLGQAGVFMAKGTHSLDLCLEDNGQQSKKHILRDTLNGRFTKKPRADNDENPESPHLKAIAALKEQVQSLKKEVESKNALIIQLTGDLHMMTKDHESEMSQLKKSLATTNNMCEGYLKNMLEDRRNADGGNETPNKESIIGFESILSENPYLL